MNKMMKLSLFQCCFCGKNSHIGNFFLFSFKAKKIIEE